MSQVSAAILKNPFPGLRPFQENEEHLFFGRENQVDAMVDKLAGRCFLAVVGASGSGKSSLVNCGLRPALHQGLMSRAGTGWRMAQFRPGSHPIAAMARALAQNGVLFRNYEAAGLSLVEIIEATLRMSKMGLIDIVEQAQLGEDVNLLVVVDQFEELFRYRQSEAAGRADAQGIGEEAAAFVNLLLEVKERANLPIFVVLTMRSDFLGDCTQFPGLAEAINAGQYLVPRMTRDERRAAIVGPVGVGGAKIAPVLVTRLVNDVGDNPDQLSILQHALNRTWANWQNEGGGRGPLDVAHYEAIGTMAHALDQHAEKAYAELITPRQQQICEKLFKALTDKATDPRGVRRPTRLETLCALADATAAEVTAVIDVFRKPSRSFLMPPAGEALEAKTIIDISHESLMRVWQRLNAWTDEEGRSAKTYHRVADTAALHAAGKASLWRDPDLQLALDWRDHSQPNETWASRYHPGFAQAMRFLTESSEAREAERAERKAQRQQVLEAEQAKAEAQARYARRMRRWALFSIALAVAAVCGAILALKYSQTAKDEAAKAFSQAGSYARAANGVTAAHNYLNAAKLSEKNRQKRFEFAAQLAHQVYRSFPKGFDFVAVNRNGSRILSWSDDKYLRLWDVDQIPPLREWEHTGRVTDAVFTDDGSRVLSWGADGAMTVWDVTKAKPEAVTWNVPSVTRAVFAHGRSRVVSWSDDGTVSGDGTVKLWDLTKAKAEVVNSWNVPGVIGEVFANDGSRVLSWGADGTVKLWDVTKAEAVNSWKVPKVMGAVFAPDESHVLSWSADGAVKLWDVTKAEAVNSWKVPKVIGAVFAPVRSRVLSWSADGAVKLWDMTKIPPLQEWKHEGRVMGAVFAPDESRVLSWSADGAVKLWDVTKAELLQEWKHEGRVIGAVFTLGGSRVLSWDENRAVTLWDVTKIAPFKKWERERRVIGAVFTPDGSRVLSWGADGAVKWWDVNKPETIDSWNVPGVTDAVFAPDGSRILSWSADGTVKLWDVNKREAIDAWNVPGVTGVVFALDGSHVLSWDGKGNVELRNLNKPEAVNPWNVPSLKGAVFAPDGSRVLSWGADRVVTVWDVTQAKPEAVNSWKAKMVINGAVFAFDGSRFLSWDGKGNVELRNVNKIEKLVDSWNAEGTKGAAFMKDGSGFLSWGDDGILRLWDMTKAEPLVQWKPGGRLSGAVFNNDETRILVWGDVGSTLGDAGLTLWNYALRGAGLESDKRILQLEVCSATQLDKKGRLVGLDMKDWSAKYKGVESWLKCH